MTDVRSYAEHNYRQAVFQLMCLDRQKGGSFFHLSLLCREVRDQDLLHDDHPGDILFLSNIHSRSLLIHST